MALLRDKSAGDKDGAEVRVRQGDALPDGSWKLVGLEPRSAVFASASGRTVLKLPAGAPIDAPPPAASAGQRSAPAMSGEHRPIPGGPEAQRVMAPGQMHGMRTGNVPIPPPPQGAQLQRMLKLKAAILKQRARQHRADDGDH
jgi:general secretion pathway protein N